MNRNYFATVAVWRVPASTQMGTDDRRRGPVQGKQRLCGRRL
jgi:hypothetical protein